MSDTLPPEPGTPQPTPELPGTPAWQEPPRMSALALVALIVGIISVPAACCCGIFSLPISIIGVMLGVVALMQFRSAPPGELKGKELALVGLIASGLSVILFVLAIVLGVGSHILQDAQRGF